MDYVNFCTVVLQRIIEATDASSDFRADGIPKRKLGEVVFGSNAGDYPEFEQNNRYRAILDAAESLRKLGFLQLPRRPLSKPDAYHVTRLGRRMAPDMSLQWRLMCSPQFDGEQATLLRIVNYLGAVAFEDFALLEWVSGDQILAHETWTGDIKQLVALARELQRERFILDHSSDGVLRCAPTYRSLVWETRCKLVADSGEIDALLDEGESSTHDFKRQLDLHTTSQKAELIKDVIAVANSRGDGGRYLLIGFTDEGDYYVPTEPSERAERDRLLDALEQDRLQTIVSNHTLPVIRINYREVAYRLGRVGQLEVIPDPAERPYAVATSIGNREKGQHRVEQDQIFMRDGAVTRQARSEEIEAMRMTAERVRRRRDELQ